MIALLLNGLLHRFLLRRGVPAALLLGAVRPGSLMVQTTPDSATVYVDSADVGTGRVQTTVEEESHRIRAAAPGYQPRSTTVSVQAGQRRSVSLPLSRKTGFPFASFPLRYNLLL
jgi:hypothetical protein